MSIAPIVILLAAGAAPAAKDARPVPTFSKDVAPIVFENCANCHRPGEAAPFALLSYKDVKKRGTLIAEVTHTRLMPPWKADKGDVAFKGERKLTEAQIDTLRRWVKGGMPEGDAKETPKVPEFADGWPLGKPDLILKMPRSYKVPAEGRDIYRNFAVATGLKEDRWVRAIDFRPGARSVVHHTLFFLDKTGTAAQREKDSGEVGFGGAMGIQGGRGGRGGAAGGLLGRFDLGGEGGPAAGSSGGLGGWAVGAQARELPKGLAYSLPKGSDLILSTHFHPSGKAEQEASTIALYFSDKKPSQRFTGIQMPFGFGIAAGIDIPAGKKDFTIQDSFTLPVDVKAFGISAHAHYLAKRFEVTATTPAGKTKTLLQISDWDFAWQEQYTFADMVPLEKGTKLKVKITYDNSSDNPRNPAKTPKRVRWGKESTDEMGSITLQVVASKESEFPEIQKAYRKHVVESGEGLLKKLLDKRK